MKTTIFSTVVLALAVGACSRHDDETTTTSARVDRPATPHETDAVDAAKRWNAAMSQRDLSLLAGAYGANVTFYGVPLRHDQVLQVLSDAFVKDPSFTQSISEVRSPNGDRIDLKRTWVTTGKSYSEPTWLKVARQEGRLAVVEQGDATSDARLSALSSGREEYCEGLAKRVVMSSDKARSLVDVPRGPQRNGQANEVRVVVTPPWWPAYAVAVIDHTTPRPIVIGWYDVVPETGEVSDALGGETLKPNADLVAQMRRCPR